MKWHLSTSDREWQGKSEVDWLDLLNCARFELNFIYMRSTLLEPIVALLNFMTYVRCELNLNTGSILLDPLVAFESCTRFVVEKKEENSHNNWTSLFSCTTLFEPWVAFESGTRNISMMIELNCTGPPSSEPWLGLGSGTKLLWIGMEKLIITSVNWLRPISLEPHCLLDMALDYFGVARGTWSWWLNCNCTKTTSLDR